MSDPAFQVVFSISKQHPTLKSDLQQIARNQGRSLSNLITLILANFVNQNMSQVEDK